MKRFKQVQFGISRAFTLVEILIVVVILGILAAIVVPQFSKATSDAQKTATLDQLAKLRRSVNMYYVQNTNTWPNVTAGDSTWGPLLTMNYMREAPINSWVGTTNGKTIVLRGTPDTAFQNTYGWIYDSVTGNVWAGSYNVADEPISRP